MWDRPRWTRSGFSIFWKGPPEPVRCSGDKNQTEMVWMQRSEEGGRESEECIYGLREEDAEERVKWRQLPRVEETGSLVLHHQ